MLRHENQLANTISPELYNMEWRKSKKIEDVSKLDHGTILYCEEGDIKGQFNEFKWHQEFTKDQDRLTVLVNNPDTDPNAEDFNIKIDMNRQATLLQLK